MKQIKGITNVKSLRNGSGSIKGIGKEIGKFIITTMEVPWQIVKNDIGGQPEDIIFIDDVEIFNTSEELRSLIKAIEPDIMVVGSDYQNNLLTDSDQERLSDSNYEQSINFGSNIAEYEYPLYLGGNYEDRIDDTYFFTLDIILVYFK